MSTKKGPQGQAILSSLSELTLLPLTLVEKIKLLGGSKLGNMIKENTEGLDILEFVRPTLSKDRQGVLYFTIAEWWAHLFPTKSRSLRKLSYFSDKEGKTRVIAIADYWSQSALRPLHFCINRYLKRIPTDCTFDQDRFTSILPKLRLRDNLFHSIDLTAATDKMPIALQKRVVSFLYNSAEKSEAWASILVDVPFSFVSPSKEKKQVRYGTGQPMGAFSSWPVMALTHHVIVQVSAIRAGLSGSRLRPVFVDYALLGDDLVIGNNKVAAEYKKLLSVLDMPFSKEKTHVSKTTFEFAKRWFHKNEEVTGFSVSGLLSVWKSYPLLHNFLATQSKHG